mgnify:CR=1 FL=1
MNERLRTVVRGNDMRYVEIYTYEPVYIYIIKNTKFNSHKLNRFLEKYKTIIVLVYQINRGTIPRGVGCGGKIFESDAVAPSCLALKLALVCKSIVYKFIIISMVFPA